MTLGQAEVKYLRKAKGELHNRSQNEWKGEKHVSILTHG